MNRSEEMIGVPFFDKHGSTLDGDKTKIIKEGVLLSPYSDKFSAKRYGYPCTTAAGGDYDEAPLIASSYNLSVKPSERTLSDLSGGELGILAAMASGGDWTNEGNYVTPVQTAYLFGLWGTGLGCENESFRKCIIVDRRKRPLSSGRLNIYAKRCRLVRASAAAADDVASLYESNALVIVWY